MIETSPTQPASLSEPPSLVERGREWLGSDWKLVTLCTLAGMGLGLLLTLVVPKSYRATATVLFPADSAGLSLSGLNVGSLSGASGMKEGGALLGLGIGPSRTPTADVAEVVFGSRSAAASVYEELGLANKLDLNHDRDKALDQLQKKYVSITKKKPVLSITAVAPDPALAKDIVLAYLKYYRKYTDTAVLTPSKRQRLFIEKQVEKNTSARTAAEKNIVKFTVKRGTRLLEAQPEMRTKYYPDLLKTFFESEAHYVGAAARTERLQEGFRQGARAANSDAFFPNNEDKVLSEEQTQLSTAEAALDALRRERTDNHPDVILARDKVLAEQSAVNRRLASTGMVFNTGVTRDQILAESDMQGAKASYQTAANRLKDARRLMLGSPADLITQQRYTLELAFRQELVKVLELELEKAKIGESRESTDLEILDPPVVPSSPYFPKLTYFGVGGALIGFFLRLLFVLTLSKRPRISIPS